MIKISGMPGDVVPIGTISAWSGTLDLPDNWIEIHGGRKIPKMYQQIRGLFPDDRFPVLGGQQ